MAVLTGADTWPVPNGAVSLAVPGTYPLPYQVKPTPSWLTTVDVQDKTSFGYTLVFAVSPGTDNETVDVIVVNE